MSTASFSTSSNVSHPRSSELTSPPSDQDVDDKGADNDATPRPGVARHHTSLQEHAIAMHQLPVTPGGTGGSTPRPEDRREGFTWEVHHSNEETQPNHNPFSRPPPTPGTPPTLEDLARATFKEDASRARWPSVTSTDTVLSRSSVSQVSAASSYTEPISRADTTRSSFSGLARGVMRHVPDMRMFHSQEKRSDLVGGSTRSTHRDSNAGPRAALDLRAVDDANLQKRMSSPPALPTAEKPSSLAKSRLKDRRKLANGEAMTISLPPNLPELPTRSRMPLSELQGIVPSRRRSPKTPWVNDHPLEWSLATAPPTISEYDDRLGHAVLPTDALDSSAHQVEKHSIKSGTGRAARVRFGRTRSGAKTSESLPHSPKVRSLNNERPDQAMQEQQAQTQNELNELGKRSRSRRWRWSGPWSSNDFDDSPGERSFYSLSRLIKPRRSSQNASTPVTSPSSDKFHWRRQQSIPARPDPNVDSVANMPVPPAFIPPGLQRVPTPPIFDQNGDVRGKLADFFFDMQGVKTHMPPPTPHSIWDSDILLMPQHTDISPPKSEESDESPQGAASTPLLPEQNSTAISTPSATYLDVAGTPTSPTPHLIDASGAESWFQEHADDKRKDSVTRSIEERAKLEWLIPEHLPNSPLCPLSQIYRGPSKGICVYHGRRSLAQPKAKPEERRTGEIIGTEASRQRPGLRLSLSTT